jgi:hypothetical protein
MSNVIDTIDGLAAVSRYDSLKLTALKDYLLTGDEQCLAEVPAGSPDRRWPFALTADLGPAPTLGEIETRLLRAAIATEHLELLGHWLDCLAAHYDPAQDEFEPARRLLSELGLAETILGLLTAQGRVPLELDSKLTSTGRFLAGLAAKELTRVLREFLASGSCTRHELVARLLAEHCPDKLAAAIDALLGPGGLKMLPPYFWEVVLETRPAQFESLAARGCELCPEEANRFRLAKGLFALNPARFKAMAGNVACAVLASPQAHFADKSDAAVWMLANMGTEAIGPIQACLEQPGPKADSDYQRECRAQRCAEILAAAVQYSGRAALPLLAVGCASDLPDISRQALALWAAFKDPADKPELTQRFAAALAGSDSATVARCARLAGDWDPAAVEADLWKLLAHKSRPVREAAAQALAKLGDSRVSKAAELWAARRADTRVAAVSWLAALATPAATAELEARLEIEEDGDVRDALLLALEELAGGAGKLDPVELQRRIRKTVAGLSGPPVRWLDVKKLPLPRLRDGSKLGPDGLLYLLHRQSRVKEMRADLEARPLYTVIDRQTSGDLALHIVQAFLGSSMDADDRWALALACLLGDDRLVPLLSRQIGAWAESARGKLAEYAVQALALLGTDAALLAVDAMAIRYRSRFKNIGKAATEAFAEAARARGLTPEELGDVVVPWLGFTPGQRRSVEAGKTKVELFIGADFKLAFRDAATGKKLASVPSGASAELKAELKNLNPSLREAVKAQLLRMETLMVRQFRWPVARWQELYLRHPLLLPFAQRLVWGAYDQARKIAATFRALPDGSLTDARDEPVQLSAASAISVIHPLELSPAARAAWVKHLADYQVVAPFPQLERPVLVAAPEQRDLKYCRDFAGTELNGLTFKGRAERLGWNRGSVCDAGYIGFYYKSFPSAGVDVFLGLEGMCIGIDMYSDITLGDAFFVKTGSVKIGSYEYDEPAGAEDPRLVPFGDVPPIAFSEAMGDLRRISGKTGPQATEESQPE